MHKEHFTSESTFIDAAHSTELNTLANNQSSMKKNSLKVSYFSAV